MMCNWSIVYASLRNGLWRDARSAVRTLQHGIISAEALGPPPGLATWHIATPLIIHAIVTRGPGADAARLPNTAATQPSYSISLLHRGVACSILRVDKMSTM